jgi:hypothetical protein
MDNITVGENQTIYVRKRHVVGLVFAGVMAAVFIGGAVAWWVLASVQATP